MGLVSMADPDLALVLVALASIFAGAISIARP